MNPSEQTHLHNRFFKNSSFFPKRRHVENTYIYKNHAKGSIYVKKEKKFKLKRKVKNGKSAQ